MGVKKLEYKDNEEYRKRIKELIDRVERNKDKDAPEEELRVLKTKERLLQTAKSKINPDFRNIKIVMLFAHTIKDYYKRSANSLEKNQFQEEIDELYQLIYDELKKPSAFQMNFDSNKTNYAELREKRRIIGHLGIILGKEKIETFYEKFNLSELFDSPRRGGDMSMRQYNCLFVFVIIAIVIVLIIFGMNLI